MSDKKRKSDNPPKTIKSAPKIFNVLDVLCRNFAQGMSNKEVAEACDLAPPTSILCLDTLIEVGYAEKIVESDRYRPSHRFAQKATSIMRSLESSANRIEESKLRINTEI